MTEILASYARVPTTRAGLPAADEPRVDITLTRYTDPLAAAAIDCHPDDHFRRNTARFLIYHPRCRIGIRDEYGQWHPTPDDPDATGGQGGPRD